MNMKRLGDNKGIGLLEVLVSMIVLAIGLLGLAPLVVTSIEGNIIARDHTVASNLVKHKVEYFQGLDALPTMPYREAETNVQDGFDRVSRIDDHVSDSTVPDGLYLLDVQVSWIDNQQIERTTAYSTFILKD